jgi:2-haloacid dehalogenase
MNERWATFDCYGTLIDWNRGIRGVLGRVFGETRADAELRRFHDIEPSIQADGRRTYREVLTEAMRRLGAREPDVAALAESLPGWPAFPEVRRALEDVRAGGWRLAILSNTDPDYIEASMRQIRSHAMPRSGRRSWRVAPGNSRPQWQRPSAPARQS